MGDFLMRVPNAIYFVVIFLALPLGNLAGDMWIMGKLPSTHETASVVSLNLK